MLSVLNLGYYLFRNGATCHPLVDYGYYNGGFQLSVKACYKACKTGTLFHYHVRGRANAFCTPIGCSCACYTKSDINGGCPVKYYAGVDLYKIKQASKPCKWFTDIFISSMQLIMSLYYILVCYMCLCPCECVQDFMYLIFEDEQFWWLDKVRKMIWFWTPRAVLLPRTRHTFSFSIPLFLFSNPVKNTVCG